MLTLLSSARQKINTQFTTARGFYNRPQFLVSPDASDLPPLSEITTSVRVQASRVSLTKRGHEHLSSKPAKSNDSSARVQKRCRPTSLEKIVDSASGTTLGHKRHRNNDLSMPQAEARPMPPQSTLPMHSVFWQGQTGDLVAKWLTSFLLEMLVNSESRGKLEISPAIWSLTYNNVLGLLSKFNMSPVSAFLAIWYIQRLFHTGIVCSHHLCKQEHATLAFRMMLLGLMLSDSWTNGTYISVDDWVSDFSFSNNDPVGSLSSLWSAAIQALNSDLSISEHQWRAWVQLMYKQTITAPQHNLTSEMNTETSSVLLALLQSLSMPTTDSLDLSFTHQELFALGYSHVRGVHVHLVEGLQMIHIATAKKGRANVNTGGLVSNSTWADAASSNSGLTAPFQNRTNQQASASITPADDLYPGKSYRQTATCNFACCSKLFGLG
ncbi:hypothetical protein BDQ12DRAFT_674595 [Crucibulum laeve]|uniref:Uncharacterized protein n=1 Tax=Crucibulum laeve TaxID=68775 RepID=A0A5C3MDE0_9AGAR|nr:hypothetical protein BDQ12DRAFT_674595 [Crucibulum laeve]